MKNRLLTASLIALTVFAVPAFAQENGEQGKSMGAPAQTENSAEMRKAQQFLRRYRNVKSLSTDELRQVAAEAPRFSDAKLSEGVRNELEKLARNARSELDRRQDAASQKKQNSKSDGNSNEDGEAAAASKRRQKANEEDPEAAEKQDAAENPKANGGKIAVQPARPKRPVATNDDNETKVVATSNSADRAARELLQDRRPAQKLDDRELRRRLAAARELLQAGRVSSNTRSQLGTMIRQDREVVRQRQAEAKRAEDRKRRAQQAGNSSSDKKKSNFNVDVNIDLRPNTVVLRDRRRADELNDAELRQRIRVYRDVEAERDYEGYRAEERAYWREQLTQDRIYLRRRLLDERQRRDRERLSRNDREIVINVRPEASDYEAEDVFAAEADEDDIEQILVRAPRKQVSRKYTVEEVASAPEVRSSIPRIEVDTIRFGFNEAIVREEEVEKLDQIGGVIERILGKYPSEVFLIEGHTDAVGSDFYNLGLSRARAEAVKAALSTYFNIPSRNLRTVGLGERFLKVPTDVAEAENRRVSIGRITQYVGEAN